MEKKYKVHLCNECIDDLAECYPYTIPREQLEIIEVGIDDCDNSHLDDYDERLAKRNPDWHV